MNIHLFIKTVFNNFKKIYTLILLAFIICLPFNSLIANATPVSNVNQANIKHEWFFFVQSNNPTVTSVGDGITIKFNQAKISPLSERPYRLDKLISPTEFIKLWTMGTNSFKADHPSGSVVIVFKNGQSFSKPVVISNPIANGTALSLNVQPFHSSEQFNINKPINTIYLQIDGTVANISSSNYLS